MAKRTLTQRVEKLERFSEEIFLVLAGLTVHAGSQHVVVDVEAWDEAHKRFVDAMRARSEAEDRTEATHEAMLALDDLLAAFRDRPQG